MGAKCAGSARMTGSFTARSSLAAALGKVCAWWFDVEPAGVVDEVVGRAGTGHAS